MQIDILTLFPQMFAPLEHSIIKRARDSGRLKINLIDFREYSKDKHRRVDDAPYGGGAGLVLMAQPLVDCIESIDPNHAAHRILLTPAAKVLTQSRVRALAKHDRLLFVCGHYEGVDARVTELCIDECVSIGEYILTGGELPAMIIADAVARHVDGVLNPESLATESFSRAVRAKLGARGWEHPQYTRPATFRGLSVPEVLLNGNHAAIQKWREDAEN